MASDYQIDKLDKQILSFLIQDARMPYTEIAKKLIVSPGTIHVRVKKLEQKGIIKGASLVIDYVKMGYTFTAYIGLFLDKTSDTDHVIEKLIGIPEVTVAHIATGQFGIFCKIRAKNTQDAKDIILTINQIDGVIRTESMISLEESINSKDRLFKSIFNIED